MLNEAEFPRGSVASAGVSRITPQRVPALQIDRMNVAIGRGDEYRLLDDQGRRPHRRPGR